MFKKIFIFICLFLIVGCSNIKYKTIDSNEAMNLIDNGAVIIDVRESDEYDSSHIKNSINLSLNNINTIDYPKDKIIIVYCASGVRSAKAAKELVKMGYTNIYNLDGGIINWGFEMEE